MSDRFFHFVERKSTPLARQAQLIRSQRFVGTTNLLLGSPIVANDTNVSPHSERVRGTRRNQAKKHSATDWTLQVQGSVQVEDQTGNFGTFPDRFD